MCGRERPWPFRSIKRHRATRQARVLGPHRPFAAGSGTQSFSTVSRGPEGRAWQVKMIHALPRRLHHTGGGLARRLAEIAVRIHPMYG